MPKIIIMGGGIGGLTVAHELIAYKKSGYEIHIYERHGLIGGMARSSLKKRGEDLLPTEYCWRIYGPNYNNVREILKQIPLEHDPSKTVHDNLVDISNYLIADQQSIVHMNNRPSTLFDLRHIFNKVPLKQKVQVLNKILYCFLISTKRLNSLDKLSWSKYINPDNSLCHDMKKYIIDIMGPYLGAEAAKVNVPSVAKTLESFKVLNRPISVMCGPTNEMWFDHWKAYLELNGVTFHLNSEIIDVHEEDSQIKGLLLADNTKVTGDVYFCSLPVECVARFDSLKIPDIKELAKRAHQLMMGIQLYFDKKIDLPNKNTAMYIPDSPWQLVIEPQGSIWDRTYEGIADFWSIGLCDPIQPGLLIKKPFVECSHEEMKQEVWYQLLQSEFNQYLHLETVQIVDYNVWDTYVFNGSRIDTYEPKFSTNEGTFYLRPENKTHLKNMYFATAYTKTDTDMFEMESAAESGRRAAKMLEESIRVVGIDRPVFFSLYRLVDKVFSRFNIYKYGTIFWFIVGFIPALIICSFRLMLRYLLKKVG
jgi:uncharacterized protein with NAD-binding domain and iron-sulfur cluster